MKHFALCAAVMCCFAHIAGASPTPACIPGTLTSYIALGAGGCYVGNDQLNNFQGLSNLAAATAISSDSVTVTPGGSDANPSLSFSLQASVANAAITETRFTYRIAANSLTGSMITLSGTSVTGDGAASYAQNLCQAGDFGADGISGCTGTAASLAVANSGSDSIVFPGVAFLKVSDDLTLDAGLTGTASGAAFVDQFTASAAGGAVPEPSMIPVLVLGVGLVAYWKRRTMLGAVNKI